MTRNRLIIKTNHSDGIVAIFLLCLSMKVQGFHNATRVSIFGSPFHTKMKIPPIINHSSSSLHIALYTTNDKWEWVQEKEILRPFPSTSFDFAQRNSSPKRNTSNWFFVGSFVSLAFDLVSCLRQTEFPTRIIAMAHFPNHMREHVTELIRSKTPSLFASILMRILRIYYFETCTGAQADCDKRFDALNAYSNCTPERIA